MLRQYRRIGHGIDRQQRVVGHHDVRLACLGPCQLREALIPIGAAGGTQALARIHGNLSPGLIAHATVQVVPIAVFGLGSPFMQPLDLRTGVGNLLRGEQRLRIRVHTGVTVSFLGATMNLVQAQVIVPPLEDRGFQGTRQFLFQGLRQPRQIPLHQLSLQRNGRGGDDYGKIRVHRLLHCWHQVGQGFTRAGARLHGQVLLIAHGLMHRICHPLLPLARAATQRFDRHLEELLRAGLLRCHS